MTSKEPQDDINGRSQPSTEEFLQVLPVERGLPDSTSLKSRTGHITKSNLPFDKNMNLPAESNTYFSTQSTADP
jgi:hypothetical protein